MWQKLKHLFVPCEENTFRPHFLERFSMGIMLVLVVLTFTISNIQALLWIGSDWMVSTVLPAVIVDLTNEKRGDGALVTLRRNEMLDAAATLKAQDMAKNGYFAHHSPAGISPWYWFDQSGYDFVHAGENLAVHFTDSSDVVKAWMKSPTHKANIMNGDYTEIGVGTAKGEYKGAPTVFVVQLFGTPKAVSVTPVVETILEPVLAVADEAPEVMGEQNGDGDVLSEQITESDVEEASVPLEEELVVETSDMPEEVVTETVLTQALSEDDSMVFYSNIATTSRPGVPATLDASAGTASGSTVSMLERSVTQPGLWLQITYGFLALVVTVALTISIIVEWRKQNPVQIAYAGGLLAVMALLFYVHTALTSGVTIV